MDAFNFLIRLPQENHIWCESWELMGPLLETFYNYHKDVREDSPLRILWKRISKEMRTCIRCVSQHHQAQEMYSMEYEFSSVGPLLSVVQSLDEERVTECLKDINHRMLMKEYLPLNESAEVISVMYEVCPHAFSLTLWFTDNIFESATKYLCLNSSNPSLVACEPHFDSASGFDTSLCRSLYCLIRSFQNLLQM